MHLEAERAYLGTCGIRTLDPILRDQPKSKHHLDVTARTRPLALTRFPLTWICIATALSV